MPFASPFPTNIARYRRRHSEREALLQRRYLHMLRDGLPDGERPLVGKDAILGWFAQMQLGDRTGGPATWFAIQRWRRDHGCPVLAGRGPKGPAWTSNYLLSAWMAARFNSDEPGGPRLYREHWASYTRRRKYPGNDSSAVDRGTMELARKGAAR